MRRRDLLVLLASAALPLPVASRAAENELDEAVDFSGQILFVASKVPALVIGMVKNGRTSIRGFGRSAHGSDAEPDGNAMFRIGSITKVFTGQVLASLAADGVVSLADPLSKYVPDFFDPLSEAGRPIRLVDLATHSAGLPREVPHEPGPPDDPFVHITRAAFAGWLKANPLLFTPGTAISYSMQGHNFDGAAMPYAPTGEVIVGSGGLYSSPRDLLRWLEWHLDRMSNQGAVERLIDHAAYLWRDGLNTVYGMDESGHMDAMALGWVIMAPEGDRPLILQKAGGLQGIFSYVAFAPARNIGVMVAINAFEINAGLAMAKAANDLIAELAPR